MSEIEMWTGNYDRWQEREIVSITTERPAHGIIRLIGAVFLFLPSLALGVRRLHDINFSGWVIVIPIIGQILSIISAFIPSEAQINQYGEVPTNTIRRIGISKKN